MSIIHDALKKVQQERLPKTEAPVIDEPSSEIEVLPSSNPTPDQKPFLQLELKSILALASATAITIASGLFIWQQLQVDVPKVQTFAKSSMTNLIHKIHPAPKPVVPVLQSLAQLTITPPKAKNSLAAKPVPVTLDIHGIMSNGNGSNLVLINDQVYQVGDEVDGAKILKIDLDSITITNNGEEQTIAVKN